MAKVMIYRDGEGVYWINESPYLNDESLLIEMDENEAATITHLFAAFEAAQMRLHQLYESADAHSSPSASRAKSGTNSAASSISR